jgi:1-acyl-sn-glycerol-3-phosphate acyltransferase
VSWLDIVALSALIPGSFVAKLQRSIFIERRRRRAAASRDQMNERHAAGDLLILFPEGTSSDGNRVLPFKSSFFGVAEAPIRGRRLAVQPVSIAYTRLDNMPMGGAGAVTAVVEFHPVVTIERFSSRKALSAHCHAEVATGLSGALAGRLRPSGVPADEPRTRLGKLDTWGANASVSE